MRLIWTEEGWEDYVSWQHDKAILRRINTLLKDIKRSPFDGIGNPEPLKGNLSGWWSRRIDEKNRIIYRVMDNAIEVTQCGGHYD